MPFEFPDFLSCLIDHPTYLSVGNVNWGRGKGQKGDAQMENKKKQIKNFYDRIATEYRTRRYDSDNHVSSRFLAERMGFIFESLDNLNTRGKLLDVGCGPAFYTEGYIERGLEYWGIDISTGAIKEARKLNSAISGNRAHFDEGDIENLNFQDDFFNVVVVVYVLEYLENDERAVKELLRVIKPGGLLIVGLNNKYSWNRLIRATTLRPVRKVVNELLPARHGVQPFDYRAHDPFQFASFLSKFGFSLIAGRYCNFSIVPYNLKMPSVFYSINDRLERIMRFMSFKPAYSTFMGIFRADHSLPE